MLHQNSSNEGSSANRQNRIAGAAKQAKCAVKEATGRVLGNKKLVADGKSDRVEGKVQNAVGGLKDALKK